MENKENIVEAMNSFLSEIINVGSIIAYSGLTVPSGYLKCDGSSYKKKDYPFLAEMLSTDDESDSFTVPDLSYRIIYGASEEEPVLTIGGVDEVILETKHLPSHGHGVTESTAHRHYGWTNYGTAVYRYGQYKDIALTYNNRYVITTQNCYHSHTIEFDNASHTHTCHYAGYGYGMGEKKRELNANGEWVDVYYEQCSSQKNSGKAMPHSNWQATLYAYYLIKY